MSVANQTPPGDELSPEAFDVLMAAVNFARNYQIRTVEALKHRLAVAFPKKAPEVIDNALRHWGLHIKASPAHLLD